MKVLIIDDDKALAETIREWLTSNFHTVEVAHDGAEGSFLARSYEYDTIILDYSLPKKDGLEVCKDIRAAGKTSPILFLSVMGDTDLKVKALEQGADDYLTKPFELSELHARLRALSRRPKEMEKPILNIGDLVLDPYKHSAERAGDKIQLTRKEFGLLEYLMRNAGSINSRAAILEHVWTAESDPFSNTIEAHVRNLRKKINANGKENMIVNIPGRGYILDTPANLKKR